jgi:sugar/nucleoside kinase (ribokinase family)
MLSKIPITLLIKLWEGTFMKNFKKYDLTCIGNALMDVIVTMDISELNINKVVAGSMHLIDEDEYSLLTASVFSDKIFCGGSTANTAIGVASFGGKVNFIGKVRNDSFGNLFYEEMIKEKVNFSTKIAESGQDTGRSFIVILDDDKERTMCTYPGVASDLSEQDLDEEQIKNSKILFIEGYLWDKASSKNLALKAIDTASRNGVKIAFTLSDSFCIQRYKKEFQDLAFKKADILFGNRNEAFKLFDASNTSELIIASQNKCKLSVITMGKKGALIISKQDIFVVRPNRINNIIDTTGAGDLFAAGVLYGLSQDFSLEECGNLGLIASAENITHLGARPKVALKKLLPKV